MKILVNFAGGSQKVELDDGSVVILSSPYPNGERKILSENGQDLGYLSSQYPNGHKYARMSDGSEYDVSNRPHWFGGSRETWEKFKQHHTTEPNSTGQKAINLPIEVKKSEPDMSTESIEDLRLSLDHKAMSFKQSSPVYAALSQYFIEIGDTEKSKKVIDNQNGLDKPSYNTTVDTHGGNSTPWKYLVAIDDALRSDSTKYHPPHYPIYNQSHFSSIRGFGEGYESDYSKPQWNVDITLYLCIDDRCAIVPFIRADFHPDNMYWSNPFSIENPDHDTLLKWLRDTTASFIETNK